MYIKSIIVDGFKSYGRRTEIFGFDSEFNAITGLNGTGKSNILDSICFVLGISNLTHVRAATLQDLVYKSGQAGVTKATVTLVFDNSNKKQQPIGYERCAEISITRQIVVGGKNKYLINGKNAQNKAVQDLFCSVQLNVNNPNFLIMQGRITKVLNMKPPEILSMIEEAAGTSMYENKREKSLALIEKKDAKLMELNALITDDIQPKLERLRQDQHRFVEYQKICRDMDYFTRLYISYKYLQCEKNVEKSESTIANLNEGLAKNKNIIKTNLLEITKVEVTINNMQQSMDTHASGQLKELEKEIDGLNQKDAKLKAKIVSTKENISCEERNLKTLDKNIKIDENALLQKEAEMLKMSGVFGTLKEKQEKDLKALSNAEKKYEAVNCGLAFNDEGEASSLQNQLITAKSKISEVASSIKQTEMELKYSQETLNSRQKETKTNDTAYLKDKEVIQKTEKDIKNLEHLLSSIDYQDDQLEEMRERTNILVSECRQIRSEIDSSGGHIFEFKHQLNDPNFDYSKIKGTAASLIKIKDPKYFRALSTLIGGSFKNVIVDTDLTAKKLLQHGNLQTRTTFIPLNKVSTSVIPNDIVKLAQNLVGEENCVPAVDLIEYPAEVAPAMKYLFGGVFICRDMNIAKQVTFNRNINRKSYTLEGDFMDPAGTLAGGSAPQGKPILVESQAYNENKLSMDLKTKEISQLQRDIFKIQQSADQFKQNKEKIEILQLQLNAAQLRIQTTSFQQNEDEITELKNTVQILTEKIEESRKILKQNDLKVKDITSKLFDSKGHRERELKTAELDMRNFKQQSEQSSINWKKQEQNFETLKLEIEDLQKTLVISTEQMVKIRKQIEVMNTEQESTKAVDKELNLQIQLLKTKIVDQKEMISSQNKELKSKLLRKERFHKQIQEMELDIKKQENEIVKTKADNKEGYNKIKELEDKYTWIEDDKQFFGAKNTRYDYAKEDPVEAGNRLPKMIEQKEKLSRNINQQAMLLLEKEEEHYKLLNERRKKVEGDKVKILNNIKDLDEKKKLNLKKAWTEVDANFGSIFSTILPGTQAKLMPPDGVNFMKGLEVKVGFNGIWKESLTELSGGQRSLVALSLILAMLKYKPAPLYILDEVDAALDLSHTQNIGSMLKSHFRNSQFIIVSLKDGMFNNANVLFRTKFVDGMSGVTRTLNRKG
ncbi:unnamed protein product [Diamesa serratosioi]